MEEYGGDHTQNPNSAGTGSSQKESGRNHKHIPLLGATNQTDFKVLAKQRRQDEIQKNQGGYP